MTRRRTSNHDAADRLERALNDPHPLTNDEEINQAVAAARALAPAVQPREAFRIALHERLRRDFLGTLSEPTLPTEQCDVADVPMHRAEVVDPNLGRVTLADLEKITPERAESITKRLSEIAAREVVE